MPRALTALGVVAVLTAAAAGHWYWKDDDRPPITDILGPQPGDLTPGLDVLDNVRNYGLDVDLPYRFRTDSNGFRGTNHGAGGGPRLLILGDSFAFGMGVDDGATFPEQLEAALRPERATVFNAGVPGYTITDQLELWDAKLHAFPVEVVVLCHTASDIPEMGRPTSLRRFLAWDDEQPATDPGVAAVAQTFESKREAAVAHWTVPAEERLRRFGARAPAVFAQWQVAWLETVTELAKRVKGAGKVFVVVLWVEGYGHFSAHVSPLMASLRQLDVPVFRGQGALAASGVRATDLYLPDKHFSSSGNALAAHQTADWLRRVLASSRVF